MKRFVCYFLFFLTAVSSFSGCRSLRATTRYYKILTSNPLPSKPENYIVPIIKEDQTRRAYKIIGEMEFKSGASERFIMQSVRYNARIHGADAVILKQWKKEVNSYTGFSPSWIGTHYPYYYRACDNGLYFQDDFRFNMQLETYTVTSHKIKAQMIVFLDHDTFGYLGFVFENTRNTDYLEIGTVISDSPADAKGFQVGDRIKQIGRYICNQGYDNYCSKAPIFTVGQEFEIVFERGETTKTVRLTAEKMI